MKLRNLVYGGAAVATALVLIACSSGGNDTKANVGDGPSSSPGVSAEQPATAPTAKVGQKITLTGELLGTTSGATITLANAKQYAVEPGAYGSKPDKGVYLVVDVTVVCTDGSYSVNPFNFKLVAADGTAYQPGTVMGFKPELDLIELSKGQKTSGKVVFDVPKAALKGAKIQVDGLLGDYDTPAAYWAL